MRSSGAPRSAATNHVEEGSVATRKKTARKKTGGQLLKSIDKELSDLSKAIEKNLAPLRREIDKAERKAGTEGARLLREARSRLNQVEIKGHSDWTQFLRGSRRDLSKALTDLERSVRPKRKKTAKKTRKKAARKKKA
jgi:hypothetical protein